MGAADSFKVSFWYVDVSKDFSSICYMVESRDNTEPNTLMIPNLVLQPELSVPKGSY